MMIFLDVRPLGTGPKLFTYFTKSLRFGGTRSCLDDRMLDVMLHFTQSPSSLRSTCSNHLNLSEFLCNKTPNNSLISVFFSFLSIKRPHIHPSIYSFEFCLTLCSFFIRQDSLPSVKQLLTQLMYTSPFNLNENPFPVSPGKYSVEIPHLVM